MDKPDLSQVSTPLLTALERYKASSKCLDHPQTPISPEQVLKILSARDELGRQLEAEKQIPVSILPQLIQLDSRLKQQAYRVTHVLDLAQYRDTLLIPSQAWWWHLGTGEDSPPWNRLDWLWKILRLVAWTGNLAFLGALAARFLSGGSGFWEAAAIAFPGILSLLQAQSELTKTGQKGFEQLLAKLRVPQYLHEEAKLVSTLLITGLLLGIWVNLPSFSEGYKREGKNYQENNRLAQAEQNYLKAVELNPDNLDAHYKLATLYEELQDFDSAKKQYLIAAKGGHLDAYNNLAYWYIGENKEAEAVNLLNQGLQFIEEKEQKLEKLTDSEKLDLEGLKYNLYKNLGWAKFEQGRDEEAQIYLSIATAIVSNPQNAQSIRNPGAAYCIYAQVLQQQLEKNKAVKQTAQSLQVKQYWQKCLELVEKQKDLNREEDDWLYQAKQKLQRGE